jgi:hypothetical protein
MYGTAFSKARGTEHWVGNLARFITGQAGREAAGICFGRGLGGTAVLFWWLPQALVPGRREGRCESEFLERRLYGCLCPASYEMIYAGRWCGFHLAIASFSATQLALAK